MGKRETGSLRGIACSPLDVAGRRVLFRGSAAVLANSSHEPFGLVGVETMAAGGVACTGSTGEDYVVPGLNSLMLETADPQEFLALFGALRANPQLERAVRRAGRATAKRAVFYLRHDVSEGAFSMLRKVYSQTGKKCRVTFEFLPETSVQTAYICGEFNNWSTSAHPMKRRKDGTFTTMFWVEAGRAYRFRYLLDGEQWWNDPAADGYAANPYGGDDSLLKV